VDIDAAFRCGTLSSSTAAESLTIFDNILLVARRVTIGGAPCPSLCRWGGRGVDTNIYDTIGVTLDLHDNPQRTSRAILLTIRTLARSLNPSDIIPRKILYLQRNIRQKAEWRNKR